MQPHEIMQPHEFAAYHGPALARDEVRHNVILAILGRLAAENPPELRRWSLGAPGECAVQTPTYPIMLGDLSAAQCHALAEVTRTLDYPAVVGPAETARWFADRAKALGLTFLEPIPQQILALHDKPAYPGAPGHARLVGPDDAELFADWVIAFQREAIPHDPTPSRDRLKQTASEGRYQFWIVDGEPVSMAGIARRTRTVGAIAGVYTPPDRRGRGYAGSVAAAVVDAILAEGRGTACLYADLRNPCSNRCYARIGFQPVCLSWHCPRAAAPG